MYQLGQNSTQMNSTVPVHVPTTYTSVSSMRPRTPTVGRGNPYSSACNAPQKTVMLPSYAKIAGIILLMSPKDTCSRGGSGIGALETVERGCAFWHFRRTLKLAIRGHHKTLCILSVLIVYILNKNLDLRTAARERRGARGGRRGVVATQAAC